MEVTFYIKGYNNVSVLFRILPYDYFLSREDVYLSFYLKIHLTKHDSLLVQHLLDWFLAWPFLQLGISGFLLK